MLWDEKLYNEYFFLHISQNFFFVGGDVEKGSLINLVESQPGNPLILGMWTKP